MKNKKHLYTFIAAGILAAISWAIAIYFWDKLPSQIPTHFGWNGQPDAWNQKSLFYVFLVPLLQSVMLGSFVFLYFKPQYSDMPTTLWLMTMPEKKREHAFSLIRTMLTVLSIWIGLLFTYMTYIMNVSAMQKNLGLSPWVMVFIIAGMLIWLTYWTIKVYKATRLAIKEK